MTSPNLDSHVTGSLLGANPPVDAQLVIDVFGLEGAASRSPHLKAALRVALIHESYLYEHRDSSPGVTPGVLNALEALGSAWLSRELATYLYRRWAFDKPGPLSDLVAHGRTSLAGWLRHQSWLERAPAFGKSVDPFQLPDGARTRMFNQVLGTLALAGEHRASKTFIGQFLAHVDTTGSKRIVDPVTTLQRVAAKSKWLLDWTFEREGPDHALTFVARVTDERKRFEVGSGRSIRAARAVAAEAFLRRFGQVEPISAPPYSPPRAIPVGATAGHRAAVDRVSVLFRLNERFKPLVSQGFIHSSWAHENRQALLRAQQQDAQVLGLVGAHVLMFEHLLVAVRDVIAVSAEQFSGRTLARQAYAEALDLAELEGGILLGRGQRVSGVDVELASNCFQALMAAVYVSDDREGASLISRWPMELERVLRVIAPSLTHQQDPTTMLQKIVVTAGLSWDFSFDGSGPDHGQRFTASLVLSSPRLRKQLTLQGSQAVSKTKAKHNVAERAIRSLRQLEDASGLSGAVSMPLRDAAISLFFLCHLVKEAEAHPQVSRRWQLRNLLGTHLINDSLALSIWASHADALFGRQSMTTVDPEALASFYRVALDAQRSRSSTVRRELEETLDWVCALSGPKAITDDRLSQLAQLANIYRTLGDPQPPRLLSEITNDWEFLYRGQVKVRNRAFDVRLNPVASAALDALVNLLAPIGDGISVVAVDQPALVFEMLSEAPPRLDGFVDLWQDLLPGINVKIVGRGITVMIPDPDEHSAGPIGTAIALALVPVASPLNAAVANLLHDLKNQVLASRQVINQAAVTRTEQLERQLAGSRHLDRAASLAQRVRAVSSLLRAPSDASTDIGGFLRRYAASALLRLPANISVVSPATTGSKFVSLDEASLVAILDNLVQNAVDAMPGGGQVSIEWTHDAEVAVIEIADDGPGLPPHVADALSRGVRIESTKPGGNGLGLLGVRMLTERIGGQFELATRTHGTAWLLTLPVAASPADPQSGQNT